MLRRSTSRHAKPPALPPPRLQPSYPIPPVDSRSSLQRRNRLLLLCELPLRHAQLLLHLAQRRGRIVDRLDREQELAVLVSAGRPKVGRRWAERVRPGSGSEGVSDGREEGREGGEEGVAPGLTASTCSATLSDMAASWVRLS